MKRFYSLVSIDKLGDGYHILLDNKPVKTKSGKFLCAPNEGIATRTMQEWANQTEEIKPNTMAFTQILNTKIDRVSIERKTMSAYVLKYIDTDLICYFAGDNENLIAEQKDKWQIWLDWFAQEFDCILKTTDSLVALEQDVKIHKAISKYVYALDDDKFTILQIITSISGSIILALAMVKGVASANQVFDACFVEENFKDKLYNAEKYGADPILEKDKKSKMQDFEAAQDYIALLSV